MMRRVIIESPFRGVTPEEAFDNLVYLEECIRDSLLRGEAPFASHAIYPGPLNDAVQEERSLGIEAGYAWWEAARAIIFYVDHGWSEGMRTAYDRALLQQRQTEIRKCK